MEPIQNWLINFPRLIGSLNQAECTKEPVNYGRFINQFPPDNIKSMQQLKRINTKMCRQRIYIYIYVCVYVCGFHYLKEKLN